MDKVVDRIFVVSTQQNSPFSVRQEGDFSEFLDARGIILLGEPGIGKTTAFYKAVSQEPNSIFLRIGEFLHAQDLSVYKDKTLYLDGLDEHRTRAAGVDVIDALVARLRWLGSPKYRISCRTYDWHGVSDLTSLSGVDSRGELVSIELKPLTADQVRELLPEDTGFYEGVEKNGLVTLLDNPYSALMLYDYYNSKREWPRSSLELFVHASEELLRESNKGHTAVVDDWVSDQELLDAASYLSAVILMSDVYGLSIDRINASSAFPSIHSFGGTNLYALRAICGKRLFKSIDVDSNLVEPGHRKLAEYLAARYLALKVREGLSLRRVMALITGQDGGVATELRGVFGWLISLLTGRAEQLLDADVYGAMIYGDISTWSPGTKVLSIQKLEELAKYDPWFRRESQTSLSLFGLNGKAVEIEFARLLVEDDCQSDLIRTVFEAIKENKIVGLKDHLIRFILTPDKPVYLKTLACEALERDPATILWLRELLVNLNDSTSIHDESSQLRGTLLRILCPEFLDAQELLNSLVTPPRSFIGSYHMFLYYHLFSAASTDYLKVFASAYLRQRAEEEIISDKYDKNRFESRLLGSLIPDFTVEKSEVIYEWLKLPIDRYGHSNLDSDVRTNLKKAIEANNNIYFSLFTYYWQHAWDFQLSVNQNAWKFSELVAKTSPPPEFVDWLLDFPVRGLVEEKALFDLICDEVLHSPVNYPIHYLELLYERSRTDSGLREIYDRSIICSIPDWRIEEARRGKEKKAEQYARRKQNRRELGLYRDEISSGRHLGILEFYARIWCAAFSDVDSNLTPHQRLIEEVGSSWANIIIEGFKASLLLDENYHSVEEIAEVSSRGQFFHRTYLMEASLDQLEDNEITEYSEYIQKSAVAYSMMSLSNTEWPSIDSLWRLNSQLVVNVMVSFWNKELDESSQRAHLTGFRVFQSTDIESEYVTDLILPILHNNPKLNYDILIDALKNLVKFVASDSQINLSNIVPENNRFSDYRTLVAWRAFDYLLGGGTQINHIAPLVSRIEDRRWVVLDLLGYGFWCLDQSQQEDLDRMLEIIVFLGGLFGNVSIDTEGARWVSDRDEPTAAQTIRKMIYSLSKISIDYDVTGKFNQMMNSQKLQEWRTDIRIAMLDYIRSVRDAKFTYPSINRVVDTLSNREPANASDLKALVMEALLEVGQEIRHGNTDGYKAFWQVDSKGKVLANKHVNENTARDRILEKLRSKLAHLEIVAEPEALYPEEKRADIAVYHRGMKLPIEIKRDDHTDIWTTAEDQLEARYIRDPQSEGCGIYLIIWFDGKFRRNPPRGYDKPECPEKLQELVEGLVSQRTSSLIDVIVMDVSIPIGKQ